MTGARIDIDLDRIEHNTRLLVARCAEAGIGVAGVSKSTCGSPAVARAMLRGGAAQIADARLDNLARLRRNGITAPLMLLRAPTPAEAERTVGLADFSLNAELTTISALSQAAQALGRQHGIVLMVDLGDLREGVLPAETIAYAEQVLSLPSVTLQGIGANLACISGIQPTRDNLESLVYLAGEIRRRLGVALPIVSGGNTFSLPLLEEGHMPAGINHLRLGAAIMLAAPPTPPRLYAGLDKRAFTLVAPVIEDKIKPARPYGLSGEDAFGRRPTFDHVADQPSRRLILAIGREDIDPAGLQPIDPHLHILGASSDHLLIEASAAGTDYHLGSDIAFAPDYAALLAAMTSPYVEKRYLPVQQMRAAASALALHERVPLLAPAMREHRLAAALAAIGIRLCNDLADAQEHTLPVYLQQGPWPDLAIPVPAGEACGLIIFAPLAHAGEVRGWPAENVVMVGLRDLFLAGEDALREDARQWLTVEDIDRAGIARLLPSAVAQAMHGLSSLHVHIERTVMAGEGMSAGLTFREVHLAMEIIHEMAALQSVSCGGFDTDSVPLLNGLLLSLLGRKVAKPAYKVISSPS